MDGLTVTALINVLEKYRKEIGCNGTNIGAHSGGSTVEFSIVNPEIDYDLELVGIELRLRMGCMCPEGVVFRLKVLDC
jgi:hypothetical protein